MGGTTCPASGRCRMLGEVLETDSATGDGGVCGNTCFTGEADDQASGRGILNPHQFVSDSLQFHLYCLRKEGHVMAGFCLVRQKRLKNVFIVLYLLISLRGQQPKNV